MCTLRAREPARRHPGSGEPWSGRGGAWRRRAQGPGRPRSLEARGHGAAPSRGGPAAPRPPRSGSSPVPRASASLPDFRGPTMPDLQAVSRAATTRTTRPGFLRALPFPRANRAGSPTRGRAPRERRTVSWRGRRQGPGFEGGKGGRRRCHDETTAAARPRTPPPGLFSNLRMFLFKYLKFLSTKRITPQAQHSPVPGKGRAVRASEGGEEKKTAWATRRKRNFGE